MRVLTYTARVVLTVVHYVLLAGAYMVQFVGSVLDEGSAYAGRLADRLGD